MNDVERAMLEKEFEIKSARLSQMMEQMPEMDKECKRLHKATCALTLFEAERTAKQEVADLERQIPLWQQAHRDYEEAMKEGDEEKIAACKARVDEEMRLYKAAEAHMQESYRRYQAEAGRKIFKNQGEMEAAFIPLAEQEKIAQKLTAFQEEYNALLKRCEELADLLDA